MTLHPLLRRFRDWLTWWLFDKALEDALAEFDQEVARSLQASRLKVQEANRLMDQMIAGEVQHWDTRLDSTRMPECMALTLIYKVRSHGTGSVDSR